MRKVIYSMMVSLDGFIEGPNRELDCAIVDEELYRYVNDQQSAIDTHLYGRRTYEVMVDYWPTADTNPSAPAYEVEFADDPLAVLDCYDLRSLIENCAFRELKQGRCLTQFPKRTQEAVRAHVFLTLVMFTLTNAYRTDAGQELAQAGIRRQRLAWQEANKVLVVVSDDYAIFDLEELLIILGCQPKICCRVDPLDVRKRYNLPDPALA